MVPFLCRSGLLIPGSYFDFCCGLRVSETTDAIPIQPATARETNIGVVVFLTHKKEQAEAILDGEGKWHCPKLPVLDRVLNILHEPREDAAGDMPFGHAELIRVAAWLKGRVKPLGSTPLARRSDAR
jgi:hypothetical protein